MSIDNMQLKDEEMLDDNVVLTDIYPISNTKSIDDSATGEKLQKTISRLWEAINGKVSRQVNSINGRSGVVVLTPDDVGLGNVSNYSEAYYKKMIVDDVNEMFKHKHVQLYATLSDAITAAETNNELLAWTPFYCEHKDENDRRACIGYFTWDDATSSLDWREYRMINTIGETDGTVWYRESESPDGPIGEIGIHIFQETVEGEQLLYADPNGGGLRVDPTKVGSRVYFTDSMYTPSTETGPFNEENFLIYGDPTAEELTEHGARAKIKINNSDYMVGPYDDYFMINKNWKHFETLKRNDIIITNFKNVTLSSYSHGEHQLMNRQPAIGTVIAGPDATNVDAPFEIQFVSIRSWTNGYGIRTLSTHQNINNPDTQLAVDIGSINNKNISGLQTLTGSEWITSDETTSQTPAIYVYTPWGKISNTGVSSNGLFITSDNTMSIYPLYYMTPNKSSGVYRSTYYTTASTVVDKCNGSRISENFSFTRNGSSYADESGHSEAGILNGYGGAESLLSLNMNKLISNQQDVDPYPTASYYNMSGLRNNDTLSKVVDQVRKFTDDDLRKYGMPDGKDINGNDITDIEFDATSGGVSVNVGQFLEITPVPSKIAEHYYDGGKVQVRVADGLTEKTIFVELDLTDEETLAKVSSDWYKYDDEFYYAETDGAEKVLIPGTFTVLEFEHEPSDWSTAINYAEKVGRNQFAFLATGESRPEYEQGVYYRYDRQDLQTFISAHPNGKIYRLIRTNRMTINIDNSTLAFDENGRLTVIGGGGSVGGGSKLRFIDNRGYFFDTDDNPDRMPDEVIKVGSGLIVTGSGQFPLDEIATLSGHKNVLKELASRDTFTAYEFALDYAHRANDPTNVSILFGNLNSDGSATLPSEINNASTHEALIGIQDRLAKYIDQFQEFLHDKADATVTYKSQTYVYSQLHMYFTGTYDGLMKRVETMFRILLDEVPADQNAQIQRDKKWQLLAFYYENYFDIESLHPGLISGLTPTLYSLPVLKYVEGEEQYPLDWLFGYFMRDIIFADTEIKVDVVNGDGYSLLNSEPSSWSENYGNYFVRSKNSVTGRWEYTQATQTANAPEWVANTYYKYNTSTNEYELTTSRPDTWDTSFTSYYTKSGDVYTPVSGTLGPPRFALWKYWYVGTDTNPVTGNFYRLTTKPENWDALYMNYYTRSLADPNLYNKVQGITQVIAPDFSSGEYYAQQVDAYRNTANGKFYLDENFTQVVDPNVTTVYHDLLTDTYWRWDGVTYIQIETNESNESSGD